MSLQNTYLDAINLKGDSIGGGAFGNIIRIRLSLAGGVLIMRLVSLRKE